MAGRIDIWIEWAIQPIRCFLEEVPSYFEQRAISERATGEADFLPDGRLGKAQVYAAARSLSLAAVIAQLNALVDEVLLMLASRVVPPEWAMTPRALSRTRRQLLDAIEQRFRVDMASLPGWHRVEAVREDGNSLKHRGGLSFPESGPAGIPIIRSVNLEADTLRQAVEEVRTWLVALWNATERAKDDEAV